jgi:hypothetical protein
MRKLFYVDREMCGGDTLPEDFDLEDFCEKLQGKLSDIEVVPLTDSPGEARNQDLSLVSDAVFQEALGEYCRR